MYQPDGGKLKTTHLERNAYLYIRQSTLRQVYENTESTKRQYALKQKAVALGWSGTSIITIDSDLGQLGSSSEHREGFKKLVAEVGMGQAGIVISIEVSRLCRNSSDWLRLLEICTITDTLIMDEDGIYDTNDFNDRLFLELKGTMSEAEIHFLQSRMRGGMISKARRGELKRALPIGYIYNENDKISYTCLNGKLLKRKSKNYSHNRIDYKSNKKDCSLCPIRGKCISGKGNFRIVSHYDSPCYGKARGWYNSAYGKAMQKLRGTILEGIMGQAKTYHGMAKARFRGLKKVEIQFLMTATALNLKKMVKMLDIKIIKSTLSKAISDFVQIVKYIFRNFAKKLAIEVS